MRQRYSLTILTVIADSEFNRFLQFQRLKNFYLESFCLSKVFIIFGVATEGANTLARFLQGKTNGNGKTNLNDNGNGKYWRKGALHKLLTLGNEKKNKFSFCIPLAYYIKSLRSTK